MVTAAKTVKIYDLVTEKTTHMLKRDDGKPVPFYSMTAFKEHVISAGDDDGALFVWDTRTPNELVFSTYDCQHYISDIAGDYDVKKLIVATSGEGTLTAYDMRVKKMIEPKSEFFGAGFQCLKMLDLNKKLAIGAEDGAIYVFNQNEWAHTSGKFAVTDDLQNRGKCSIDCIDLMPDKSTLVVGGSDGKMRTVSLWPHEVLTEKSYCRRMPLESIHVHPKDGQSEILVSGGNYINIVKFEEPEDDDNADKTETIAQVGTKNETEKRPADGSAHDTSSTRNQQKRPRTNFDDYLQVFN